MGRHRAAEEKDALREQAIAMRRAGIGAKRIASELGIGGELVRELLRDEPVPASLRRPRAKDELRETAIELRRQGRTYDEIQDELGVSKGSLSLWLREMAHPTDEQRARVGSGGAEEQPELEVPPDAEIARALRRDGWLLREIAAEVGVSIKTVCVWCRGLPVPPRGVHGRRAEDMRAVNRASWDVRLARAEEERQTIRAEGAADVRELSGRELDLLGAAVYWCEGGKSKPWRRDERLHFINSDPDIIRLWLAWLRIRGIKPEDCWLSVNIHETGDVEAATVFWAGVVGVEASCFAKPVLKRHNPKTVRKNTGEGYVGRLAIYVRKSRRLYQEIEGRWQGIAQALESL